MSATGRPAPPLAIPARLNLALLLVLAVVNMALLWAASHLSPGWALACALAFSYTANTTFALLHEAVHGIAHPDARVNRWMGRLAAAFFPTSLAIQRAYHLTHHRHNRSEFERFDYIQPGESAWLKRAQWYAILTGLYWAVSVAGLVLYVVAPWVLDRDALRSHEATSARQTAARIYMAALDEVPRRTAVLEVLASFAFQAVLFVALDLSFAGWALCYAAFALQWSSLQYADHAFSPLDRHDGAWDLRVNRAIRALFLNYHLHRTHHRHPQLPWLHLPRLAEGSASQPSYFRVWLRMWRGPRRLPHTTQDVAAA